MQELTDEQLVIEYLQGDAKSLEVLIKRYVGQIYGFVYGYVKNNAAAEDIAQETFIKAWKKIKKFDTDKKFKSWIYTVARNTALDYLKKKRDLPFSAVDEANGENVFLNTIVDQALRPDQQYELYESDNWFEATVAKLSDKYRQVVIMRHSGLAFREIALKLKEPLHTVKSRYRRALIILKKHLN